MRDQSCRRARTRALPFSLLLALTSVTASTTTSAQQSTPDGVQRQLAHADSLFLKGSFEIAAQEYRAIVERSSDNDLAWLRLGLSLERLGRDEDAVNVYSRSAQRGSQQVAAELGLARVFTRTGKTDTALEHLRKAATLGADPATLDQMPALAALRALAQYAEIRTLAEDARYPCRKVHTFDFWVGDFDAMQWSQTTGTGGRLHNTREYEGCAIIEHWSPLPGRGPPGMSLAYYEPMRKVWRFVWIDDSNGSIEFEGNYRDGAMRLEAWFSNADGTRSLARNVLQNVSADTIRHLFSVSNDSGKTWTIQADDRFVRRRP